MSPLTKFALGQAGWFFDGVSGSVPGDASALGHFMDVGLLFGMRKGVQPSGPRVVGVPAGGEASRTVIRAGLGDE